MFYFIADTHFGHRNVLKLCERPFETIEEMNETIIRNWNSRVKGSDTVCILGDLFFVCKEPEPILKRLHGKKRLIVGNHDSSWMSKAKRKKGYGAAYRRNARRRGFGNSESNGGGTTGFSYTRNVGAEKRYCVCSSGRKTAKTNGTNNCEN